MDGGLAWLAVYAVIALSMASVVWFFQVRRAMIARMRAVVGILEDVLRPRDKTYTLLGYLVGFRAVYELGLPWSPRAWVLYTMPPGHVFFYLPVVLARRMRDRLELTFSLREPPGGEAHLYSPGDRFVRRLVARDTGGGEGLRRAELLLGGRRFVALYSREEVLEEARALAERLLGLGVDVRRVTISGPLGALHVSLVPSVSTLRAALGAVLEAGERVGLRRRG